MREIDRHHTRPRRTRVSMPTDRRGATHRVRSMRQVGREEPAILSDDEPVAG
jgi:hypothetical protein